MVTYIRKKSIAPDFSHQGLERDRLKFALQRLARPLEQLLQHGLDFAPHRARFGWLVAMRREQGRLLDRPVNVPHLDSARGAGQARPARRSTLRLHEPRLLQVEQQPADHNGIGVHCLCQEGRGAKLIATQGENRHHMNRESEPAAFHAGNLARGLALTSAGRSHFPRGGMKAPQKAETRELWRVAVEISADAEDAASELIGSHFGHPPSVFTDVETGRISATIFVESRPVRREVAGVIEDAFARMREFGLNPGTGRLSITKVRKQDWAESWKRHFKPFTVGSRLLVKPSWSKRNAHPGQKVIVIDPGLSFGTGQHPTTRFCLEQLAVARIPSAHQAFLDVGTGSGILAIAAAKLGYWAVRGFDFDPAAVRIAKENARKNRVKLRITGGDITKMARSAAKYDVVCANLTADLLENSAAKIAAFVKPSGRLVLAGILRTQIFSVRKCFELRGFLTKKSQAEGEWESLLLHRANY